EMSVPQQDAVSDLEWMKNRMASGIRELKEFEQSDDEEKKEPSKDPTAMSVDEPLDPNETTRQTILQTGRLFLRNLTFSCTSEEIQELFSQYGPIEQ
ncbi:hypothetical protein M422DRAFT_132924, partial [Sphaerobolus stellatus SS14]